MLKRRNFPRPFSDNTSIHLFVIFMATISLGKINHLDKFMTKYQLNHYQYYMILVYKSLRKTRYLAHRSQKTLYMIFSSVVKKYSNTKKSFPRHRQKLTKKNTIALASNIAVQINIVMYVHMSIFLCVPPLRPRFSSNYNNHCYSYCQPVNFEWHDKKQTTLFCS